MTITINQKFLAENPPEKANILIVDDDPGKRRMLGRLLTSRYNIQYVDSGAEAIKKSSETIPDIILLDVNMPQMDGFNTCQKLRAIEALQFSKIMIVSGRALDEDKKQGIEAGANDYISLPFDETEFILRIDNMIKLKYAEEMISRNNWTKSYDPI